VGEYADKSLLHGNGLAVWIVWPAWLLSLVWERHQDGQQDKQSENIIPRQQGHKEKNDNNSEALRH